MWTIGIDPGAKGGWAILNDGSLHSAGVIPYTKATPTIGRRGEKRVVNHVDWRTMIETWPKDDVEVWLEHPPMVVSRFSKGKRVATGASDVMLGRYYQQLDTLLISYGHGSNRVTPQEWQKYITKVLPRVISHPHFKSLGIHPGRILDTKELAMLACLCEWPETARETLIAPKCRTIHSGMSDAACIALAAWSRRGGRPRLWDGAVRYATDPNVRVGAV